MKKIAILGGSFNPIHNGHLIAANAVYDSGHFERVILMPAGKNPLKTSSTDYRNERYQMCCLATQSMDFVQVSDHEITQTALSYSYNSLVALADAYPQHRLYWIVGYDIVFELEQWYNISGIFSDYGIAVVNRAGYSSAEAERTIQDLERRYDTQLLRVPMLNVEIASSQIRRRVRQHQTICGYTTDAVIEYIHQNNLYREGK